LIVLPGICRPKICFHGTKYDCNHPDLELICQPKYGKLHAAIFRPRHPPGFANARAIAQDVSIKTALGAARANLANARFSVDYTEARHAETIAHVASRSDGPIRLLAAAWLGKTRLIDNVAV
jgi:hypothetical protein